MALQMATVDPDWKRQAEWRERTVENINKSRQRRLEQLGKQHKAIRRAIETYDPGRRQSRGEWALSCGDTRPEVRMRARPLW